MDPSRLKRVIRFWDDGSKDPFTSVVRIVLTIAYFTTLISGVFLGGRIYSDGEWWQLLATTLFTAGFCTIVIGHALLGYASYRRQKQFHSPNHAANHMAKIIFLTMFLPTLILGTIATIYLVVTNQ